MKNDKFGIVNISKVVDMIEEAKWTSDSEDKASILNELIDILNKSDEIEAI